MSLSAYGWSTKLGGRLAEAMAKALSDYEGVRTVVGLALGLGEGEEAMNAGSLISRGQSPMKEKE